MSARMILPLLFFTSIQMEKIQAPFTYDANKEWNSLPIHITHLLLIFRLPYFVQMINFYRKQIMPKQLDKHC
ncbi:hypothetical protein BF29_2062 [Heyndrickxia coagulans DSM 1 = ATCC 7050]|uniref:Uncharacterized protein n=1 Tax=Heyndrickxia coagulans DSM 1 = ATCC 7050 TaxID=1121088 RepID=A0A0B5WQS4_HEYCO|nr:hypothetical protein BF29_2058 [Heyndrickxia coagulans DSM 1 = ATCC 7050]AJH78290.1 hypothetical protein BF29_2062 [Heyndrickxia coagulans DSM 1 = ATCC 7050]RGR77794.1 hypothetical protein DWY22_14775 [Heyndrickxia coagulans]RGR93010.1 hypothetical protein DWY16_14995 [Heyndrickxia coagulans]SHG04617.1 hypothetical protein SAMN02745208_03097 [Heyndrickxia coagulans DSM 1 = ATCC 7050]